MKRALADRLLEREKTIILVENKTNWQLEKEERIKPSLWWKQVSQAQAQAQNQTTSTEQSDANTPKLTNLSADGKAWFIHPVAMMDYFCRKHCPFQKGG
ncbi:MAG: hypothetical protein J6562_03390 [Candidatus Schmidhempelia sp.]|nr:hypothetical protein [Candidatus Schmidhempelia sp.]